MNHRMVMWLIDSQIQQQPKSTFKKIQNSVRTLELEDNNRSTMIFGKEIGEQFFEITKVFDCSSSGDD